MKKIITILLLLITFLNSNAQFTMQSIKEFQKLKQTKTYVVLHDSNPDFNAGIKKAVELNWKLTPYDFIYFKDLKNYSNSDKNSFILVGDFGNRTIPTKAYSFYNNGVRKSGTILEQKQDYVLSDGQWKSRTTMGSTVSYGSTTLNIQLGGAGKYFNSIKNWLAFTYAGYGNSSVNSAKLIPMIKLLENIATLHLEGKVKDLKATSGDSYKIYNPEKSFSDKTLVLLNTEIPYFDNKSKKEFTVDDIKKTFTGKVKIVNNDELSKIVDSNDKQSLYFGSYVEGTFTIIFLYDNSGSIHYIGKMNRMSFNQPESKGWFINALEKMDKAFQK